MRFKNTLKPSVLIAALLLTACAAPFGKQAELISEDSVLPIEEIDRMVIEFRKKATDNPSVENLANFNRILTVRTRNQQLLAEEAKAKAAIPEFGFKHQQVSRDYTLDWDNYGRGGAAMRQPAFVHTLSGNNNVGQVSELNAPFTDGVSTKGNIAGYPALVSGAVAKGIGIATNGGGIGPGKDTGDVSYSIYEMSRWERYCNNGKGMDKRDWAFVKKQGLNNVPYHLRSTCVPPAK